MPTIATLAVQLTANIGGFASGMGKAVKPLAEFGGHVVGVTAKIGGLVSAAATLAAGGGLAALVATSFQTVDALAKTSDKLGTTTEELARLHHAAKLSGVGAEEFDHSLGHLVRNLGEAAVGSGEARVAIAELGLNAQKLASQSPAESFKDIAGAMHNVKNSSDRVRLAFQLFGREGISLLNVMGQGKDGLEAAGKEADRFGLSLSRMDAAKVEAANRALLNVQEAFSGAADTLAVQLAPFVEALAEKLLNVGESGDGMAKTIINGFEAVLSAVAKAADYLEVLKAGWQFLRGVAGGAIYGIVKALSVLLDGMDWLLSKLGKTKTGWGDALGKQADALKEETSEAFAKAGESWQKFESGVNSKAAARAIDDIRAKADQHAATIAKQADAMKGAGAATEDWKKKLEQLAENAKKVTETLVELRKSVATFGMNDGDKKLFDLKALGASPEQLDEAKKLIDQLKQLEAVKVVQDSQKSIRQFDFTDSEKKLDDLKTSGVNPALLEQAKKYLDTLDKLNETRKRAEQLQSEGQSVFESTRSPLEKYETQLGKLSDLLNSGAIDWDTYGRAIRQARGELESATKVEAPELFKAGSAQAQKFVYDQTRGSKKLDKTDVPLKQLQEQQESRRILLRIENNLKDQQATTETVVTI